MREQDEGGGRPKIILIEVVKNNMSIKEITNTMTSNIIGWWKRIHVANPNQFVKDLEPTPKILGLRLGGCCISYSIISQHNLSIKSS